MADKVPVSVITGFLGAGELGGSVFVLTARAGLEPESPAMARHCLRV
jgi:hypothetical protein